jgi:nucleoside-diphosphate-sugar epimerase
MVHFHINRHRGAHNYWLKIPESPSGPNGLINLVHYDDAAEAVLSAFEEAEAVSQEIFLIADGQALTRAEICKATVELCPVFRGGSAPNFAGDSSLMDGKRYNVAKAQSRLHWSPKFAHFSSFMGGDYAQEMKVPLLQ